MIDLSKSLFNIATAALSVSLSVSLSTSLLLTTSVLKVETAHAGPTNPYVIYGVDNRREVIAETDLSKKALADSVVAFVATNLLRPIRGSSDFTIHGSEYGVDNNLCFHEKYWDQVTPAFCTGFLVSDKIIATAGHCVNDPMFCSGTKFVFGFQVDAKGKSPARTAQSEVYECKKILHFEQDNAGADFALVELDRPVTNHKPLTFAAQLPSVADSIFVIGHPSGLPTKIADGAKVRKTDATFFVTNLDTYGGNSGSPVFNDKNEVAGVLVRGETDFYKMGSCNVSMHCKDDVCRGEDVTNGDLIAKILAGLIATSAIEHAGVSPY